MIKVGVLGCGKIAERHLLAYKKMPTVEVITSDIEFKRAKEMGSKLDVPVAEHPEALLISENVQAIDVCIPTHYHKDAILKALKNGKHVFCEKPLCANLEEALEIQKESSISGKTVMVGYLYRFHPAFQFVKKVLDEGVIGQPYFAIFRLGGRGSHAVWKHKKEEGGGAVSEMLVHKLDLISWYFGNIFKVTPLIYETILDTREIDGKRFEVNAEDLVLLKLEADGVKIICESDLITPSYMDYIEIHGDNGSIFSSILDFMPTMVFCKQPRGEFRHGNNIYNFPSENLFEKELGHFVDSIKNGSRNINSIEDSVKTFKLIDQIRRVHKEDLFYED